MSGYVLVNGEKVTKAGQNVACSAKVELIPSFKGERYVSRGGLKLEKALAVFGIVVRNRICLDIGCSTGGFTDCLLQHGAKHIYAVDVGYGQIDWKIRNDKRVTLLERQNARYLTREMIYGLHPHTVAYEPATLAVIDVSFISLKKIWSACSALLDDMQTEIVSLIKPQFEAGRALVAKGGVVRSKVTHILVINQLIEAADALNLKVVGLTHSPMLGPAGNIEFLLHLKKRSATKFLSVEEAVEQAHRDLIESKGTGAGT